MIDELRCTGRTTRRAVEYVRVLLAQPGVLYHIYDHHSTKQADRDLMVKVRRILITLGVDFVTNGANNTIEVTPISHKEKEDV